MESAGLPGTDAAKGGGAAPSSTSRAGRPSQVKHAMRATLPHHPPCGWDLVLYANVDDRSGPLVTNRQIFFLQGAELRPVFVGGSWTFQCAVVTIMPVPRDDASPWMKLLSPKNKPDARSDGGGGTRITWPRPHGFARRMDRTGTELPQRLKSFGFPPGPIDNASFTILSPDAIAVSVPPAAFGDPSSWKDVYLGSQWSSTLVRWVIVRHGERRRVAGGKQSAMKKPTLIFERVNDTPMMKAAPAGLNVVAVSPEVAYDPNNVPSAGWVVPFFKNTDRLSGGGGWQDFTLVDCPSLRVRRQTAGGSKKEEVLAMRHLLGCRLELERKVLATIRRTDAGEVLWHFPVTSAWKCHCLGNRGQFGKEGETVCARVKRPTGAALNVSSRLTLETLEGDHVGEMPLFFPAVQRRVPWVFTSPATYHVPIACGRSHVSIACGLPLPFAPASGLPHLN